MQFTHRDKLLFEAKTGVSLYISGLPVLVYGQDYPCTKAFYLRGHTSFVALMHVGGSVSGLFYTLAICVHCPCVYHKWLKIFANLTKCYG